jgi:hypothetical protein
MQHCSLLSQKFEQLCVGYEDLQVRDFIQQLLHLDPTQRLGNITGGAAAVKAHAFFDGVDWDTLAQS